MTYIIVAPFLSDTMEDVQTIGSEAVFRTGEKFNITWTPSHFTVDILTGSSTVDITMVCYSD